MLIKYLIAWKQVVFLRYNFEANHNKDYSVVKLLRWSRRKACWVTFFFLLLLE